MRGALPRPICGLAAVVGRDGRRVRRHRRGGRPAGDHHRRRRSRVGRASPPLAQLVGEGGLAGRRLRGVAEAAAIVGGDGAEAHICLLVLALALLICFKRAGTHCHGRDNAGL